ncbi:MAG: SIMPL domain-containing protein [Thermoproteota archaeon]|nr:SIMPL domain-containing protein [Candidatus Brockarchaeota archaeon]
MDEKRTLYLLTLVSIISVITMGAISYVAINSPKNSPNAVYAQTSQQEENLLTVSGTGTVRALPDLVSISIGVETQGLSANETLKENADKMNAVINSIIELGIDKQNISTSGFFLYPIYIYPDKESPKLVGYRASNTILVVVSKFDIVGKIIDTSVSSGANKVLDVSFMFSEGLQNQLRNQAIENAVNDAKNKAETALKPLNMKIVGVKSIQINEGSWPTVYRALTSSFANTPILPGEQQVSVSVQVVFIISQ